MLNSKGKKDKLGCDVPFKTDTNQYIKLEFECELKKEDGKSVANIIKDLDKIKEYDVHYYLMEDHSIEPKEDAPKKGNYLLNVNMLFTRDSNEAKVVFGKIKHEFSLFYNLIEKYILNDCKQSLEIQVCFTLRKLYKKIDVLENYVSSDFVPLCNNGYRSLQENIYINISVYNCLLVTYDTLGNVIDSETIYDLYNKMVAKIVEFNEEVVVKVRG